MAFLWYAIWFLMGASIFSFLNAAAYRIPRKISFVKGRSFCPSCNHTLSALDLIPIVSWAMLRGKCRYCGKPISVRYTVVELIGGALGIFCASRYVPLDSLLPETSDFLRGLLLFGVVMAFLALLMLVTLVDMDTMEIPNGLVIAMFVIAAVSLIAFPEIPIGQRLIGCVCVSVPMFALACVIPGAFGGGDIKLMAACGLFLGWKLTLISFFLAVFVGGLYGIYLLAEKKKEGKDHFAFGPSLCLGMAVGWFYGQIILDWYMGTFLGM